VLPTFFRQHFAKCYQHFSSTFFSKTFFGSVTNIFRQHFPEVLPTFFQQHFSGVLSALFHQHFSEVLNNKRVDQYFLINIFSEMLKQLFLLTFSQKC
jgi:hypothetical protein